MVSFCRGPLPKEVLRWPNVVYFAPDSDVPPVASGIGHVPMLGGDIASCAPPTIIVYIDAHRVPGSVLGEIEKTGCDAIIQGDPDAVGATESIIVKQLLLEPTPPPMAMIHTDMLETVHEAVDMAYNGKHGYVRILCSNKENRKLIMDALRPGGRIRKGDPVYNWKQKYKAWTNEDIEKPHPKTLVKTRCGRHAVLAELNMTLVETPNSWGSGECDTLVIMPDVPEALGISAARRVRYKLITVGVAPSMYLGDLGDIDE